jgi:6-phosphogluconolactonase
MASALLYVGGVNRGIGYVANPAGKGIAAFDLDIETGTARPLGVTEEIDNPTFVAVAPDGGSLTAVSEGDWPEGQITAYAIDAATGALAFINKQPTGGGSSCHLGHDHSGGYVGVANYGAKPVAGGPDRSFVIYPRRADGSLGAPSAEITHTGSGPNAQRQSRPHAHCIRWTPDNRFVVVADLGIDRLMIYRFDAASGAVAPHGEAVLAPGSGPRHFRFHPQLPLLYCANELDCTLSTMTFDAAAGTLKVIATISTLPPGGHPGSSCSAIDIAGGGRHVYVGNRGHDSIARFGIDTTTGIARLIGTTPAGGQVPRDFAFDPSGSLLAVANQESDCVSLFRYRAETGDLDALDATIDVGSPTAIAFHPQLRRDHP